MEESGWLYKTILIRNPDGSYSERWVYFPKNLEIGVVNFQGMSWAVEPLTGVLFHSEMSDIDVMRWFSGPKTRPEAIRLAHKSLMENPIVNGNIKGIPPMVSPKWIIRGETAEIKPTTVKVSKRKLKTYREHAQAHLSNVLLAVELYVRCKENGLKSEGFKALDLLAKSLDFSHYFIQKIREAE